jgi:hypothetical protein
MYEPGLDRHEWETELESLREGLEDSPAEALPDLANLVQRMLEERGFELGEAVADGGEEPEIVASYRSARETADAVDAGADTDPGDVAQAINDLLAVFDYVNAERPAP